MRILVGLVLILTTGLANSAPHVTPHDFQLVRASTLSLQEEESYAVTVFRDGEVLDLIAGAPIGGLFTDVH